MGLVILILQILLLSKDSNTTILYPRRSPVNEHHSWEENLSPLHQRQTFLPVCPFQILQTSCHSAIAASQIIML